MAKGPKMAPMIAQSFVFAPLLWAICQSKNAQDIHKTESNSIPAICDFSFNSANYQYIGLNASPLSIPACPTQGAFEIHALVEAIVTQSIEIGLRFRHRPVGMVLDSH
jgi:hypothetical protein